MREKKVNLALLATGFLLVFAAGAQADNTTCVNAIYLVADGSPVETTFTASFQSRWFKFHAEANRSYAQMTDNLSPGDVQDTIPANQQTNSGSCAGPDAGDEATTATEPRSFSEGDGAGGTSRLAFKDPPAGSIFFRWVASAGTLRVRIVETTLFSPRWSTFSGFLTSWGFLNTTNAEVNVTLRVFRVSGGVTTLQAEDPFSLPPGQVVFKSSTGLGIPTNRAGFAIATHDGPPGAIHADAFMVSPDGLTGFPVEFEPRTPQK